MMLEAGCVGEKNVKNIVMKNILDIAIAGLVWFICGHGIAYGAGTGEARDRFIGHAVGDGVSSFAFHLNGDKTSPNACEGDNCEGYQWATFFFQFAFSAVAATIVSGAVAERTKVVAYMVYTTLITGFIYPVVVHWGWSSTGGFSAFNGMEDTNTTTLSPFNGGVIDFAGSGIVHMTGGVAALVGAIMVGPRLGRFENGKVNNLPQNNYSLIALGSMILWTGWYGFNCGSTLGMNGYGTVAARTAVTTTLAPCAACLIVVIIRKATSNVWDLGACCNGLLGGLVSITAGCSTVDPWAAIVIGFVGGLMYLMASNLMLKLKIDDPLDAFAVHGACGAWGVLSVGLFARKAYSYNLKGYCGGFFKETDGCDGKLFVTQLAFVLSVFVWVGTTSFLMFGVLKVLNLLRVDKDTEIDGLDYKEHGGAAYDIRVTYRNKKAGYRRQSVDQSQDSPAVHERDVEAALEREKHY